VAAGLGIVLSACSGGASPSPSASSAASAAAPSVAASGGASPSAAVSAAPSVNLPTAIGPGEGEVDIVIWGGYAEDGSNVKEYDWVNPFIAANPDCGKVNSKPADTSDAMVTLMKDGGGGLYDGVSASGDATLTLINRGDVAPVNVDLIPDFKDLARSCSRPPTTP
jgi:putative spermidine/putrescine transport system substrate-binding protein